MIPRNINKTYVFERVVVFFSLLLQRRCGGTRTFDFACTNVLKQQVCCRGSRASRDGNGRNRGRLRRGGRGEVPSREKKNPDETWGGNRRRHNKCSRTIGHDNSEITPPPWSTIPHPTHLQRSTTSGSFLRVSLDQLEYPPITTANKYPVDLALLLSCFVELAAGRGRGPLARHAYRPH